MEYKTTSLELKDMSRDKRTAVIAHAVYNVVDRAGDISKKGMFNKSWNEYKTIDFLFNHDPYLKAGTVMSTYEDEEKAYTTVGFGNWKLGDDMLEMLDAGVITGASFGYKTEKKSFQNIKGRSVRVLQEVWHFETTLTNKTPVNPLAGVVTYTKTDEGYICELKASIDRMENFCRNSNASDETIKNMLGEVTEQKHILSNLTYDTVSTLPEQDTSAREFTDSLLMLTLKNF